MISIRNITGLQFPVPVKGMGAEAVSLLQEESELGIRNNIRMTVAIYLRSAILNMNIRSRDIMRLHMYVFIRQQVPHRCFFFIFFRRES